MALLLTKAGNYLRLKKVVRSEYTVHCKMKNASISHPRPNNKRINLGTSSSTFVVSPKSEALSYQKRRASANSCFNWMMWSSRRLHELDLLLHISAIKLCML